MHFLLQMESIVHILLEIPKDIYLGIIPCEQAL